jgi:uncharacterized protein involved in exopolysaccharide biosynthesis
MDVNTPANGPIPPSSSDEIDLFELWEIIWSEKWWVVGTALLLGAGGAGYSLWLPPVFEAKVVLSPAQQAQASSASSLLAQFAPIAGIAGVSAPPQVGVATLQSVQFAENFIVKNNLLPILLEGAEGAGVVQPDIRDAIQIFQQSVVKITNDAATGLLNITVSWKDPVVAAEWANAMAKAANETLRDQALAKAERNLAYLNSQLPVTTSVTVQQSIGRLLDQELQTVMLAKGNPEFAFKVIDPAKVPKTRSSPKRAQMTVLATLAGGLLGLLVVFFRRAIRSRREFKAASLS